MKLAGVTAATAEMGTAAVETTAVAASATREGAGARPERRLNVPLLVRYPQRVAAGQKRTELIEAVDIAPTLLDYCGVQIPPAFQGRSSRPLIEGRDYTPRRSAFIEFKRPFAQSWRTVRTAEFKYCASGNGQELLFDIERDPNELTNVAENGKYASVLNDMRRELVRRWFDVESQYPRGA